MIIIIKIIIIYQIAWFQKLSIPPPQRELEIPRGWGGGVNGPGNSGGDGVDRAIWFPHAI